MSQSKFKIVVIGSGLAGLSAALEAYNNGAEVTLIEKNAFLGGNSSLASSGLNAVNTPANPNDSIESFYEDSIKSGGGFSQPTLVNILVNESSDAVAFLTKYGIDLSVIGLTGGHSHPRTHRAKPREDGKVENIGRHIINKLVQQIKSIPQIRILLSTTVCCLLVNKENHVVGVQYSTILDTKEAHVDNMFCDAVILATGGYSADKDLLTEVGNKDLSKLPTTNGPWANGDGIKIARKIGAHVIHLDKVQIHPTGIVDIKDPFNEKKWLCPEALRGCGGILVNSNGERFVNELDTRDNVTDTIFKKCQCYPSQDPEKQMHICYLILNNSIAQSFDITMFNFYKDKGLIQTSANYQELAKVIGCDPNQLKHCLQSFNQYVSKEANDPLGRKSCPCAFNPDETLYYLIITPAIHYTMGGIEISDRAEVLTENKTIIPGLYAAGEVTGGVHGNNRLGGNSLLECVVFGRRAGKFASQDSSRKTISQVPGFIDASGKFHESVLNPNQFIPLRLRQRFQLNKTSHIFSFALPNLDSQIGLLVGQYVAVRAVISGKEVVRFYSPISRNSDYGKIDLLVKIEPEKSYLGSMTGYLNSLEVGNTLEFKGPLGGFEYHRNMYKEVGMIAGGTGISPMVQIIRSVVAHPEDKTQLKLLYGNYFEDDILCKDELMYFSSTRNNVSTYITLNNPPPHWKMGKGFVTEEMIKQFLPPPANDIKIVLCGPPPMISVIRKYLTNLGYTESMIFSFI